ncbi:dihydrofolate reductase family protein [Rhizobium bangladeshense]|uniref:dihydrofolate reductase family protein n=1 Tax=Rhizobium bangladeshense TaxID=1138189 RepID=UPI00287F5C0C|nr:dihydrofolate reductase family protein [Rhizobium bangladeshense]
MASGELTEEIARLKARKGRPIIAHGGVSFVRSLVDQGLVDQFALIVAPWHWARAFRCSANSPHQDLKLVSSKAFPAAQWRRSIDRSEPVDRGHRPQRP